MKKAAIITGILSIILISAGALEKGLHWPGAGIALTLGVFCLVFLFAPFALINNYRNSENKSVSLYVAIFLTIAVLFVSAQFKIMHWPGAGVALMIALPFPFVVLIPFLLYNARKGKSINLSNLIVILLFFAYTGVTSAFLALNLSKDIIVEAVQTEKEIEKLHSMIDQFNKDFEQQYKDDMFVWYADQSEQSFQMMKSNVQKHFVSPDLESKLNDPEKIEYKDGFLLIDPVKVGGLFELSYVLKFFEMVVDGAVYSIPKKDSANIDNMKNYMADLIGNNMKIWTYANISLMEGHFELYKHLYMKQKIFEDKPQK